MSLIFSNQELISKFVGENSLRDGKITKIEILEKELSVSISIDFIMRPSSDYRKVRIKFIGCKEYGFNYTDSHFSQNISHLKFLRTKEGFFYASFDPYDETGVVDDTDNDFILSKKIHAYVI